jgi:hypothetical protein
MHIYILFSIGMIEIIILCDNRWQYFKMLRIVAFYTSVEDKYILFQ